MTSDVYIFLRINNLSVAICLISVYLRAMLRQA